jgi:hypothetical protein
MMIEVAHFPAFVFISFAKILFFCEFEGSSKK